MAEQLTIALHYPNRAAPPQGVWWWDGLSPRLAKFYYDKDMEALGDSDMGTLAQMPDFFDVEEYFQVLSERYPVGTVWRTATVSGMTPVEYLTFVRKQYLKPAKAA